MARRKRFFNVAINGYLILQKKKKGFSNITKNELLWCREEISFLMSQQIDFQCRSKWCKFRRNLMEDSNFEDLLIKDSSWTIHENNIHTLLIEIYKSLNHVSPPIMQEFFDLKVTTYSLRNNNILRLPKTNTSRYGTEAPCFKGSIIRNSIPNWYKNLDKFKQQIKMWKPTTCTCKLCKAY